ncbi:MAG: universal stress protein [Reyranella sp.]|uniref:universal stress protein n=1 Tax=Reyranella sp. TaxID=1929291 RepID=UPI003D12A109
MYKSILAISEGGPDAVVSFGLAARIARMFGGTVDAVHFAETHQGDLDIASQAMPFLKRLSDDRLRSRAAESKRAFHDLLEPLGGSTFAGGDDMTRDRLITLGRYASLVLLGRPGADAENIAPSTVRHVLYDCARPVVIAPPNLPSHPPTSVVVAWNGSAQAARAVGAALPFLEKASKVIVMAGAEPNAVGAPRLVRYLARRGIAARVEAMDAGAVSGRARGRALLGYARDKEADFLVMGAYGHGQLSNFLGLGGATAKVISSCPIPLLLAH